MKVSELKKYLNECDDNLDIYLECAIAEGRAHQKIYDLLIGSEKITIVSREAVDADPLNQLPTMSHLHLVGKEPGIPE